MTKQQFHTNAHFLLLLLIAFNLPIAQWVPIFISLLLLNWLIEGDFKNKFSSIVKNKFTLLFVSFYVLHLLGLIYTQNLTKGLFDVQVKLSLLLFPLVLTSRPLNTEKIRYVFIALMIGCIAASLTMLIRAIHTYVTTGENNFYYEAFASFLLHPSYSAMYINVVLAWLLLNLLNDQFKEGVFSKKIVLLIILFFTCMIVLLSSKMGLITMLLLYTGFLIYYVLSRKKYLVGTVGVVLIGVSVFVVLRFVPELSGRIDNAMKAITTTNENEKELESTAVRMLVWKAANQVISENKITGVGTGDAKDELMKEYEKRGMTGAFEHKLNAHNEYYQVFVSLGLIGFLLLLSNLMIPLWHAFRTNNGIYMLFLLIISLNFLTESMFETQAGVMFYAFFNSLLCFQLILNHEQKTTN